MNDPIVDADSAIVLTIHIGADADQVLRQTIIALIQAVSELQAGTTEIRSARQAPEVVGYCEFWEFLAAGQTGYERRRARKAAKYALQQLFGSPVKDKLTLICAECTKTESECRCREWLTHYEYQAWWVTVASLLAVEEDIHYPIGPTSAERLRAYIRHLREQASH